MNDTAILLLGEIRCWSLLGLNMTIFETGTNFSTSMLQICSDLGELTLDTLTSVCIFSIQFSMYFLRC